MHQAPPSEFESSVDYLKYQIELFLKNNPTMKVETFGWVCVRDTSLVERLRNGGDVTTRKMDKILAFLRNPNQ